jgi:hypothetical protein
MPTDEERREYPHMSEEDWEDLEEVRALKERGEWPFEPSDPAEHTPSIEELILDQLREQTALLREIRDRLTDGG